MTHISNKELKKMTTTPPNPIWAFIGYIIAAGVALIILLGLAWVIKLLIGAIF